MYYQTDWVQLTVALGGARSDPVQSEVRGQYPGLLPSAAGNAHRQVPQGRGRPHGQAPGETLLSREVILVYSKMQ